MKARPTIFLSGVSHEFGSFRDAVETEIQMKGCFAENQPSFAPDYNTVEEMLRRKLHEADAVIHIVGFRFGAEPHERPADTPRRSYTQMEFDIAREMQKPVYVFLSNDATLRDAQKPEEKPEDADAKALQLAHREAVQKSNYLYYFFKGRAELCKLAAEIPIVVQASEFTPDISRIIKYAPAELIGREDQLKLLDNAWLKVRHAEPSSPHLLTFVALGGEGKTSLVAKWVAALAGQGWPGCDAAFAWSFYSQGTRELVAASSDLFLKEALTFFGDERDKEFAASPAGAFEKGQRLARIVGQRRCLLMLDGLEPLQYAPTSPTPGRLKDQGMAALLKGLAAASYGLCLVTTRYSLPDLRAFWQTTALEVKLLRLSRAASVHLLKTLEVRGSERRNIPVDDDDPDSEKVNEYEKLVEDVKGHALTLQIMGGFLKRAFGGDIRQRDRVKFEKADEKIDGGHAFRAMAAYAQWMEDGSDEARRELAILRCLGLFDRPATRDCLEALLQPPAIAGLTEPLVGAAQDDWQFSLDALDKANLLAINRDSSGTLVSLDTHPHIREYFSKQLREKNPEARREAHVQIYQHLCSSTKEGDQPTLEYLQPLYQAVAHGCQAGLQQAAYDDVWVSRIRRGNEVNYTATRLGAFGSDLAAIVCFFDTLWTGVSAMLRDANQADLLNYAAFSLGTLGRLTEALEPMRAGMEKYAKLGRWLGAATAASNLSELELTLGKITSGLANAAQSVTYADLTGDLFSRKTKRAGLGDALHQAGRRDEAAMHFREAEEIHAKIDFAPFLYSVSGFKYCDLLLAAPERAAWQIVLGRAPAARAFSGALPEKIPGEPRALESSVPRDQIAWSADWSTRGPVPPLIESCRAVFARGATNLKIMLNYDGNLLDIALSHLTLGRAALYEVILMNAEGGTPDAELEKAKIELDAAVSGFRGAGQQIRLPDGLLTRAWLRYLIGSTRSPQAATENFATAQADLDEAWEIAEGGPMKLFMVDIYLHRARLFFSEEKYPWKEAKNRKGELVTNRTAKSDLDEAEYLINASGYHRRDEELADAKKALGQ
jgi:tetratricopeptide (TPR) repeat protein